MTPEETVDLGGVQVKTSDPTYKRLVSKWYTNEQLVSAYQNIQKTRPQSKLPSNNTTQAPVEQPPQQQPQPSVVVNTAPVDTTATDMKSKPIREIPKQNKPELLPQSDYLDDSEARQTNIVANLNNARLTNPQSLKTVDDFRKYYNYAGRSELQRQTLDNWYKWFTTGKDLAMKSTSDILNMYKSGTITNTELDNINVADPEKYNEIRWIIEKDQKMNKYANELYTGEDKKTTNPLQWIINNYVNNLKNFANDPSIYTEYKDAMNSDNIKAQNRAIIEWQADLDSIDLEIANKENEIKKRYEWSWATSSKINAIVADETKDLYNMKSNKSIALNTAINKYNSEVASIKDTLEMKKQEQELQTQQRQQQMSELWFAMNLMSYETPDQQEERAWNNFIRQQEYVDGNIYSNDPATRKKAVTKAVESVLTEFAWIPITRSKEQIVSDIQALVDSGKDLWQAITENVRNPIMNKDEYKIWLANKLWIQNSTLNIWGSSMERDDKTNSWKQSQDTSNLNWSTKTDMRTDRHNNPTAFTTDVAKQGWLVEGVDYVKGDPFSWWDGRVYYTAKLLWDGYEKTIKAMDNYVNQKWYLPKWTYAAKIWLTKDFWKTASYQEKINMVTKMYNNEWGSWKLVPWGGTSSQSVNIDNLIQTDPNYKLANNILNGIGWLPSKNDKNYNNVVNAMWEITNYRESSTTDPNLKSLISSSRYDKDISDTWIKQIQDIKTVLWWLSTLQWQLQSFKKDTWPIEWLLRGKNPYDVNAQSIAAQVNALAPKVARWVFGEVGVLTDTDIERYMKTIPNGKMPSDVSKVVWDLLKIMVYKSFINTVTTNAQAGRNMTNFIPDYKIAKTALNKMWVSEKVFDSWNWNPKLNLSTISNPFEFKILTPTNVVKKTTSPYWVNTLNYK